MWEPEPLTTLKAPKACRGENFTFNFSLKPLHHLQILVIYLHDRESFILCHFLYTSYAVNIEHTSLISQSNTGGQLGANQSVKNILIINA
jgi:hypothetical protein